MKNSSFCVLFILQNSFATCKIYRCVFIRVFHFPTITSKYTEKALCTSFASYSMEVNKDMLYTAFVHLLFLIENALSEVRELLRFNMNAT